MLDKMQEEGYTATIQLDGKGFDITQHHEIKEVVDVQIYNYIADNITHVDPK